MSPAGGGRHAHPLSRGHSRIRPRIPTAAREAASREPLTALRRSARSLSTDGHGGAADEETGETTEEETDEESEPELIAFLAKLGEYF